MAEVRGEGSLSYAAYAPFFDQCVPIGGIYASSPTPDVTIAVMRYVLRNMLRIDISKRQLRRFLDQYTVEDLLQQMTSDGRAKTLAKAYLYFDDVAMAGEIVDRLRDVDAESIRGVVSRYMLEMQYGYLGDTLKMGDSW